MNDKTKIVIAEYDDIKVGLEEVKSVANFIPDVSTDEGYDKSKRVSLDVGKLITRLDQSRKDKKAYYLEGGRAVDSQAKEIKEALEALQLPHKEAYKQLDNALKDRERQRKELLESRVADLRVLPESMRDADSSALKLCMEHLAEEDCMDFFEFTESALKARNASRKELSVMFASALESEKHAEELTVLRKEKEERDRIEHENAIRDHAKAEAEAEKNAAIDRLEEANKVAAQAEKSRVAAVEAAENNRIAAEAKAVQDAIDAEERQKAAVKQAEVKAKQDAYVARQAEEEAQAKREANKKHCAAINNKVLSALIGCGITREQGKEIIKKIVKGEVPSTSIQY
jgi:chemotaxis protein histidine kinase CheA